MKKISKSMAKKIALMLMLSSAVGMHSVWAEPGANEIEITPSGTLKGSGVDSSVTVGSSNEGVIGGSMGATVNKIYNSGGNFVRGIKVSDTPVTADSITNGIVLNSHNGVYGIEFGGNIINSITGLGKIEAVSSGNAYGIYAAAGNNTVEFTGAESSITVKTNGVSCKEADGITFKGTGTTKISGLGSITAEAPSTEDKIYAIGIGAQNDNTDANNKFSVSFADAGGIINVYSGNSSTGIELGGKTTVSTSEVKNVKTINSGFNNSGSGEIVSSMDNDGIVLEGGVNKVEFTGAESSITVKSSESEVHGIRSEAGTNEISNLGSVVVTTGGTASEVYAYGVYTEGGVNTISFKGNVDDIKQAITATNTGTQANAYSIYVTTCGKTGPQETQTTDTTVNIENVILSGKIYNVASPDGEGNETSNLTLKLKMGGKWQVKTGDVTGDVDVIMDTGSKIEVAGKDVSLNTLSIPNNSVTYDFNLDGLVDGDTILTIKDNKTGLTFTSADTFVVTTGDFEDGKTVTLIKDNINEVSLYGGNMPYFIVDGEKLGEEEFGDFFRVADQGKSITFTKVVLDVTIKPGVSAGTPNEVVINNNSEATVNGVPQTAPKDGRSWKDVYGGYSETEDVKDNIVTINGGLIKGSVYAGKSDNSAATVSGNKLNWNGGTIKGKTISGNYITISGTKAKYLGTEGTITADNAVELTGILTVGDTDTASKLTFASGVNIGKNAQLVVTNGSNVTLEGTSTLSGTVTAEKITNDGILNVDGSGTLTLAIAIAGDGTLNVESGTDLIYTGSEIDNKVIIEQGATMDPDAGVFKKDVTNYGTLVLEGGNLGTKITNNGGTMKVTSPVTIDTNGAVTIDANSTLAIAVANFKTDAAVKGITSSNFTLADGAKIKLTGDTDDETYYTLLAGENTAIVDLVSKVSDGLVDETGEQFTESDVKTNGDGTAIIAKVSTLNVDEMNLNSLAGIQQGMVSMQNITVDTVAAHMGLINKAKGEGKYAKEIWASYLNNKDNVDGFNMAKYDAKYNGVTVGVDFYSSEKSVAGVALTYAKGDVSGNGIKSGIRNDSKYYGISFYDRVDLKSSALLMDLGYMNSKNETNVSTTKSVTGDAKVDSYTLGVRWEKDYKFKNSKLVPFAGVRYLRLNSKDFGNSRGLNYSTNSQNLFQPKIGVAWAGDYKMQDSAWNFKPKAEVGYLWALGNREADTALSYKGHDKGNMLYDVTDKSSYYAKLGIEFNRKNFAAGIDYSYMKGSSVRSNRWNVNLSWSF